MEDHYNYSDREFEILFLKNEFPSEDFTHEAHLRLAWIYLSKYGLQEAVEKIPVMLKKYVRKLGAEEKYHETLTIAAIRVVYHFYLRSGKTGFRDFLKENPRLSYNFKDLLMQHYEEEILYSQRAKRYYVQPFILAFD